MHTFEVIVLIASVGLILFSVALRRVHSKLATNFGLTAGFVVRVAVVVILGQIVAKCVVHGTAVYLALAVVLSVVALAALFTAALIALTLFASLTGRIAE